MKYQKDQSETYREAIDKAKEFWTRGNWDKKDWPYIPSSNMADVFLICLNSLYHGGRLPFTIHKSRGNSWIVDGDKKTVVNAFDHREGVIDAGRDVAICQFKETEEITIFLP